MNADFRTLLVIAVIGGALLGALIAFLEPVPVPVIVIPPGPAACEVAQLMEEARRITAEAADDAG